MKENNDKKEKMIYDYNNNIDDNEKNMFKNLSYFSKFKIFIINKCFIFSSLSRAIIFLFSK